jgi:hypothetical protein
MHADLQLGPAPTTLLDVCTSHGRLLSFANRGTVLVNNGPLTVLGSDNDGWIRLQASGQSASWPCQPACLKAGQSDSIVNNWLMFYDMLNLRRSTCKA